MIAAARISQKASTGKSRSTLRHMRSLGTNLGELREDFESVRGEPFEYFYCPILHGDEDVPLTKGHVIPESMGGKSKVLQRRDVDNGFGSFFEAEASDAIVHGIDGDPLDIVFRGDPDALRKLGRRFKLRARFDGTDRPVDILHRKMGEEVEFFASTEDLNEAIGRNETTETLRGSLAVELDARSSILVTSLRTSHLSWFQKCGYRYVFSSEGLFVAGVLRSFFSKFIQPRSGPNRSKRGSLASERVKKEVDDYCFQFANFIRPIPPSELERFPRELQQGTPDSGWFIFLWDRDVAYGRISIVKFGNSHIAVMTPVITDARGWALMNLAANLELEYSFARYNPDAHVVECARPSGQVSVWPSIDESMKSRAPVSIRQAAELSSNRAEWWNRLNPKQ